jgi:hypothetical protein
MANLMSSFLTPLRLPNPELITLRVDTEGNDTQNKEHSTSDNLANLHQGLTRPDPETEYEIFDMIINKFWSCIEEYDVEDRAEIYQLILNRMQRANSKEDVFKVKENSLCPKNVLFFKLCIEYKRIIQLEELSSGTNTDSVPNSREIEKMFWKKDAKEVARVLVDLVQSLKPKVVTKLEKMIRFYALIYVNDAEELQRVETALFSKIKRLPDQEDMVF